MARMLSKYRQNSSVPAAPGFDGDAPTPRSTPTPTPAPVPSVDRVTSRMDRMCVDATSEPVVRRGKGGSALTLYTNHIGLRMAAGRSVHEYMLQFEPEQDSMAVRGRLLRHPTVLAVIGHARVHDGGKYFLPVRLPDPVTAIHVPHPDQSGSVVVVRFVHQKQVPLERCLHLFNVCMKQVMARMEMTQIRRSYFDSEAAEHIGRHGLEVWPGYISAVHCYEGGLKLNIDVAHKVLHTRTALDVIADAFNMHPDSWQDYVMRELIGSVVMTRYNKKTYRVDDICYDKSPLSTFKRNDGTEYMFKDYYKACYMIDIKQNDQPMLISRLKRRCGLGQEVEVQVCLVPELCYITGLVDTQRSDHMLMKSLTAMTAVKPDDRVRKLETFIRRIKGSPKAAAVLQEWGLALDDTPSELPGRQFAPEQLLFGGGKVVTPNTQDFSWDRNVKSHQVLSPVSLHRWLLVFLKRNCNVAQQFVQCLMQCGSTLGIDIARPQLLEVNADKTDAFLQVIRRNMGPQIQLVVTIMPVQREDRYAAIKRLCCVESPVPSQVVNFRTLNKDFGKLRPIVFKIALQINCKLGGELWACRNPLANTMVCGVDVYHDSLRSSKNSVLALVSALNSQQTRFYSQARKHRVGQELGDTLSTCLMESIKQWHKFNNSLPVNIVLFRDGVGDGQLSTVQQFEVSQYRSVFSTFGEDYKPNLYVIVVQKRINTRIFANRNDGRVKGNAPPGAVVDHTVTARNQYDFFLVSQHVNQGTVTPTHYVVVHEPAAECRWSPEYLQRLAYQSCHLYFNWCGTIRVPAAVQYAHRLAYMVGQVLGDAPNSQLSSHLFYL